MYHARNGRIYFAEAPQTLKPQNDWKVFISVGNSSTRAEWQV